MKKITKKLVTMLLAAVMVMAMGVTAFAAEVITEGDYDASVTLYKEEACTNESMGNQGIESVKASYNGDGTVEITLVSKKVFYSNEQGQLNSFALYSGNTKYEADSVGNRTFVIENFPAADFQEGSVLKGEFTSYVSIMGTRTGYLKVNSLTEQ